MQGFTLNDLDIVALGDLDEGVGLRDGSLRNGRRGDVLIDQLGDEESGRRRSGERGGAAGGLQVGAPDDNEGNQDDQRQQAQLQSCQGFGLAETQPAQAAQDMGSAGFPLGE